MMLCKDCGIFTSQQVISRYKNEIEDLNKSIATLKKSSSDLVKISRENEELKIINKHLMDELKGSKRKRILGIF